MPIDTALLAVFIPTFFFVAVTPGMCMTLAMTLGMTIGIKRTLWMMIGEMAGVALVATAAVVGVAALLAQNPSLFIVLKYGGGLYLAYLGVQMWLSRGRMAIQSESEIILTIPPQSLALQGLITAIANPKAWAFMVALLPPFIKQSEPLAPQLSVLLAIIVSLEFASMMVYAAGGRSMRHFLEKSGNVRLLNRIAGTLMIGVGLWLACS